MERASVSDRAKEREGGREGRRGIRLGIRQLGHAAWLEADCELVLLKSLQRKRELDKIFIIVPSSELIWIYFIFQTERGLVGL